VLTTFEVMAEPTRRRILDLLLERPRSVGELVQRLALSQPGTSKHLRVLREAGLVRVHRDAQRRMYELRPEPLAELDAWLQPYRRLWADRLDALERHLDAMPDTPDAPVRPPNDASPPNDPGPSKGAGPANDAGLPNDAGSAKDAGPADGGPTSPTSPTSPRGRTTS
jgi:DNA-binding transcriptional ArsR family regulator